MFYCNAHCVNRFAEIFLLIKQENGFYITLHQKVYIFGLQKKTFNTSQNTKPPPLCRTKRRETSDLALPSKLRHAR